MGITNLQKIFVQYCKIRNIEAAAFRALTNLVELDLGENLIQVFHVSCIVSFVICFFLKLRPLYHFLFLSLIFDQRFLFQEVPSEALQQTKALMRLNLSGEFSQFCIKKSFSVDSSLLFILLEVNISGSRSERLSVQGIGVSPRVLCRTAQYRFVLSDSHCKLSFPKYTTYNTITSFSTQLPSYYIYL